MLKQLLLMLYNTPLTQIEPHQAIQGRASRFNLLTFNVFLLFQAMFFLD